MALTQCPDCKSSISTEAANCPSCGRPQKIEVEPTPWWAFCCGGTALLGFLGVAFIYLLPIIFPSDEVTTRKQFPKKRAELLQKAATQAELGKYYLAASTLYPYLEVADSEFLKQWEEYQLKYAQSIPANKREENLKAYTRLFQKFPKNQMYWQKIELYRKRITTYRNEVIPVPGIAFMDGTDLKSYPPSTVYWIKLWRVPGDIYESNQKVVCQVIHGDEIIVLDHRNMAPRSFFLIQKGDCVGWVSETFLSDNRKPVWGEKILND